GTFSRRHRALRRGRARSGPAAYGRDHRAQAVARRRANRAGLDPDGARKLAGEGPGHRCRCRRLPRQAVSDRRAPRPAPGADPRPRLPVGRAWVIAVNSLRLRLLVGAAIWIVLALAVAGTLLAALFRGHVERRLEAELATQLEQIAAALGRPGAGSLILTHQPSDPRLRKPYSGFYWQVDGAEGPIFRSRSLWDVALRLPI